MRYNCIQSNYLYLLYIMNLYCHLFIEFSERWCFFRLCILTIVASCTCRFPILTTFLIYYLPENSTATCDHLICISFKFSSFLLLLPRKITQKVKNVFRFFYPRILLKRMRPNWKVLNYSWHKKAPRADENARCVVFSN